MKGFNLNWQALLTTVMTILFGIALAMYHTQNRRIEALETKSYSYLIDVPHVKSQEQRINKLEEKSDQYLGDISSITADIRNINASISEIKTSLARINRRN